MAGGGAAARVGAIDQKNAEIYSPPYLFKGARPTISSAPSIAEYGVELRRHDAGRGADREGLADPLAVGHARVRPEPALPVPQLHRRQRARSTVQAPANANLAPPGDYMLFLVDANGVPSVGVVRPLSAQWGHDAADARRRTSTANGPRPGRADLGARDRQQRGRRYNVYRASPPASRRRRRTGSRSRRARATPTPASPLAPTTTRSQPRTTPATSARRRTRRVQRPRRATARAWSAPTASTRAAARRPPTSPGTATTGRSRTRPGRRGRASSATRSPSTARTRSSSVAGLDLARPDDRDDASRPG